MSRITTTVDLPSNGRVYPIKQVTLQNMTIAEEKYLYGSSGDNAIDNILKSCITDKKVNIDDLIVPDKHFLLVQLRVLTYGEDYPVDLECRNPDCRKQFSHNVKLSTLEVDELPEDFKEPIKFKLPFCGDELEAHIPRSGEVKRFDELAEKKADKYHLNKGEVSYIFNTMLGIDKVNGDEMVEDELYSYISELHAKDSSYIKHVFSKIKVGYYLMLSAKCPYCGRETKFRLPMTSDFFLTKFED